VTARRSQRGLDSFRSWLGEHGLSQGTIDIYVRDIAIAGGAAGLPDRLRDDELAPKTRRHILAAGRRFAEFTDNDPLTKALKKLRLPPPRRRSAKVPITRAQLFEVVDELARASYIDDPMRGTLGMMACRGFRCGDVLRLRRRELEAAREHGTLSYEAKGKRRLEFKIIKTYRKYLVMLCEQPGKWERVDDLVSPYASGDGRRKAAAKAVERALTEVGSKIGVWNLHPHRLRRTYAVEYLRSLHGDPEALIKLTQHMQWASMATAMEYVDHARGDELDRYAERIFDRSLS